MNQFHWKLYFQKHHECRKELTICPFSKRHIIKDDLPNEMADPCSSSGESCYSSTIFTVTMKQLGQFATSHTKPLNIIPLNLFLRLSAQKYSRVSAHTLSYVAAYRKCASMIEEISMNWFTLQISVYWKFNRAEPYPVEGSGATTAVN